MSPGSPFAQSGSDNAPLRGLMRIRENTALSTVLAGGHTQLLHCWSESSAHHRLTPSSRYLGDKQMVGEGTCTDQ